MTIDRTQVREAMRAAALRLDLRVDDDGVPVDFLVENFASAIAGMVDGAGLTDTREPRRAGRVRVEDELTEMVKYADKLKEVIEAAAPGTVQALWDAPTLRSDGGELYRIDVGKILERLLIDLTHLRMLAKRAPIKVGDVGAVQGNRSDLWATGVIRTSAWHYGKMTGREIDQSRAPGSFHALLSEVFASLGISRSVERAVRDAKRNAWT